jgi:hypothetical protein
MEEAAAAVRGAEMLAGETAATVWAAQGRRVQRGLLQYETEHRRIGANVFDEVHIEAEAGRGELRLWRGVDAAAAGTPPTEPYLTLDLDGARVALTKTPRKEQPHTFRVTLTAGGKHIFGCVNVGALADWVATLTAEICLCALRPDERQGLIEMHHGLLQQRLVQAGADDSEPVLGRRHHAGDAGEPRATAHNNLAAAAEHSAIRGDAAAGGFHRVRVIRGARLAVGVRLRVGSRAAHR